MSRANTEVNPPAETQYASTAQVATALGVSVTTVKRWVDDGVLPARRTHGGHRKLLLADVLRLVRDGNLPRADLSALLPAAATVCLDDARARLAEAADTGDTAGIRPLLLAAYRNGLAVETLADEVIAPVLLGVGRDWAAGRIDVLREHRVTQACVAVLYELRSCLRAGGEPTRPVAVGGAPEGDHYLLPTLLAKLTLLDAGWEAINLGPNTPFCAFRAALERFRPRLVWLSASELTDVPVFVTKYAEFHRAATALGVAVVIGGRALTDPVRAAVPHTFFGERMTDLAAFARSLHRRPAQPKRGRPRLAKKPAVSGR